MTEQWISEGRQWCKYCRIYISSNVNQVLQHETGRKHKWNEEAFIREVSLKVTSTPAGASAVASELMDRINELQKEKLTPSLLVQPEGTTKPETKPANGAPVKNEKESAESYPASAHEAHGQWIAVPVAAAKVEAKATNGVDEHAPISIAVEKEGKLNVEVKEEKPSKVLRIGATDEADEEEAAVRDEAKMEGDASAADWDVLEGKLRKRTIRKKKKKRKRL